MKLWGCTSDGVYVPLGMYLWWSVCTFGDVPLVECMYLWGCTSGGVYVPLGMYLWWSVCTFQAVPLVEFMYLVSTRMPGESYHRQLGSLLLCLCDVFRALINPLVCWFDKGTDTKPRTSHHQSPRGQERGTERGRAQWSSLNGWERVAVSRTNAGTGKQQRWAENTARLLFWKKGIGMEWVSA